MIQLEKTIYEIESMDLKEFFKYREKDSHKGMFGRVGIMGGSLEYSGAVKLASISCAAVRSGCGVVRVMVPEAIASAVLPHLLEQTLSPVPCDSAGHMIFSEEKLLEITADLNAIAIGMGWGCSSEYEKIMKFLLENYSGTLIIDADGLNTLAKMNLDVLKDKKAQVVITPHLKEFERLTKRNKEEIQKNAISITKEFARDYDVILLLKGSTTIITDGNVTYLSRSGCPGMATAGSGDVLSGIIAGMLGYHERTVETVAFSAYFAGVAGELAQEKYTDIAMKASDTIEFIPNAIKKIRNEI